MLIVSLILNKSEQRLTVVQFQLGLRLISEGASHDRNDPRDGLPSQYSFKPTHLEMTYLLNNTETVGIVSLEIACAHERENWHDVVQDSIGNQSRKFRCHEQSTLRCPWVGRS
jgi:hypothetical protein